MSIYEYSSEGTLTPLLKKLEKLQLIERIRNKDDERNVMVFITERGKMLREKFIDLPQKVICNSGMTLDEAIKLK